MLGSLFGGAASAPTMFEIIFGLMKGLLTNFGITFFSAIVPLIVGIPLSFVVKKSKVVGKIFGWVNIPFECICVPIFIFVGFYIPGFVLGISIPRIVPVIVALTMAYLLYMPSRYNQNCSFLKNTLYNGLGLISNLFKWSFVAKSIAVVEALSVTVDYTSRGMFWSLIVTFLIAGAALLVIEVARTVIKQFMK